MLHLHERTRAANDLRTITRLNDISDEVHTIRAFADAAFMVGENVPPDLAPPLLALLSLISDRLNRVADVLQAEAQSDVA